jgi:hypothetical protein
VHAPGERLAIKIFETLSKAGAGLAKPWQTRRVGQAKAQAKADELRVLAAAKKDAEDLRKGVKVLDASNRVVPALSLPSLCGGETDTAYRPEPRGA